MALRTVGFRFTLCALALSSANLVLAQSNPPTQVSAVAPVNDWHAAQQEGASQGRIFVVTLDQPQRRQACRVESFTPDRLVCSRMIGGGRTYLPRQVLALLLPGDENLKLRLVIGFNAGLGAAIWGTVVLATTCPVCAAAAGVAALLFFSAAGASLVGDDQPDRLLYLAPGQQLSRKLGYVQS